MKALNVFLKRYFIKSIFFSFFISWISCTKNSVEHKREVKRITLDRLLIEETYSNRTKVFTNDSIFCIDRGENNCTVWRNGQLSETNNNDIRHMVENNENAKFFHVYKYQSEFMRLDFEKYSDKDKDWSTKDYKILKDGKQYFLYSKGAKIKLPVTRSTDMDWVTFNSMDINNDKIPELFIFHEYFNSRDDEEYGKTHVYEVKNN